VQIINLLCICVRACVCVRARARVNIFSQSTYGILSWSISETVLMASKLLSMLLTLSSLTSLINIFLFALFIVTLAKFIVSFFFRENEVEVFLQRRPNKKNKIKSILAIYT